MIKQVSSIGQLFGCKQDNPALHQTVGVAAPRLRIRTKRLIIRQFHDDAEILQIPLFAEFMNPKIPFEFNGLRFGALLNMEAVLKFHFIMDSTEAENKYLRSPEGINFNNFRDKLSDKTPMYKKYDTLLVDSLLKMNLAMYGINDKFRFAYVSLSNLFIMIAVHLIWGLTAGVVDNLAQILTIRHYPNSNFSPYLQALHCAFGSGACLSPVIIATFLGKAPAIDR